MKLRVVAAVAALLLVLPACGSRLNEDQRVAAIRAGAGGGVGGAGGDEAGDDGLGEGGLDAGSAADGGGTPGDASNPGDAASGPGTGPGGGPGGNTNAAAPPGGNGGATDIAVTGTTVTISNISDISGPVPGLFKSAQQATQAFVAYFNSKGGLYGRKLKLLPLDSQTDSGANRTQTIQACKESFAIIGSMSAFDDGGAAEADKCGIPDLTSIPVNPARGNVSTMYAPFPNLSKYLGLGSATYIKEKYPNAIKTAAMMYAEGAVTRSQAERVQKGYESIGYDFVYTQPYNVAEPNFSPYILDMRGRNVQYITAVADYSSIVRIQQAMRQQNYVPEVRDWNSVVYDAGYIAQGGQAVEGSLFFINTTMFEEAAGNAEMQLYLSWLRKVAPGAKPTYFGIYAWSAGRLFEEAMKKAGPNLKRAGLIEALKGIHQWSGNGLHATHDVGAKIPADCFLYAKVQGGKFVRVEPAQGFSCDKGGLYKF